MEVTKIKMSARTMCLNIGHYNVNVGNNENKINGSYPNGKVCCNLTLERSHIFLCTKFSLKRNLDQFDLD